MSTRGYYRIHPTRNARLQRRWYWTLHAENHEVLCTSEHFNSSAACEHNITVVRELAAIAERRYT